MLWQEHSPFSLLNNYKHLPLLIKALLTVQLLGYVLVLIPTHVIQIINEVSRM